jgi:hypothetical protein
MSIPVDFNYDAYRDLNHDLKDMNNEQLHHHYLNHGIYENRQFNYNKSLGFFILRYVQDETTNIYWQKCYDSIRKFYPNNKIIIIDDNSNYDYITEKVLDNTIIIRSEFPKRGELLPYYYYLHNKYFDIACIIHDSVFIQQYINLYTNKYKILWEFEHEWDVDENVINILKLFNNNELIDYYLNKSLWKGCFGGMSIITHDFLVEINQKYNINILLNAILDRENRKCFERIIGCIMNKIYKDSNNSTTLFGDLHHYMPYGIMYNDLNKYHNLPMIKVWTGR